MYGERNYTGCPKKSPFRNPSIVIKCVLSCNLYMFMIECYELKPTSQCPILSTFSPLVDAIVHARKWHIKLLKVYSTSDFLI